MSTPDQRARDKDRDAAIEVVKAACADGQIIEADRDKRVEQLLRAQTLAEVQMLTHDLRPPVGAPAPVLPVATAPSTVQYGPSMPARNASISAFTAPLTKLSKTLFLVPLVIVLVVGISVIGGVVALVRGASDGVESIAPGVSLAPGVEAGKGEVNVISGTGFADLIDAVKTETGATKSFSAVLYPTYAVVELPVDATSQREKYYDWDGRKLSDRDSKSTSTYARFDLRTVDPAVVVRLVRLVRRLSDDPTSWYAVIHAPDESVGRSMIWAYASNDYSESVYVGARRDGTIVYNSTHH